MSSAGGALPLGSAPRGARGAEDGGAASAAPRALLARRPGSEGRCRVGGGRRPYVPGLL